MSRCNSCELSFVTGCLDVIVVSRALLLDVTALLLDAWM